MRGGDNKVTDQERITELEKRVANLEKLLVEQKAAAATTAQKQITVHIPEKILNQCPQKLARQLDQKIKSLSEGW